MSMPKHVFARLEFARKDTWPSAKPLASGFRCPVSLDDEPEPWWDAGVEFVDVELAEPGQQLDAYMGFISPDAVLPKLEEGTRFTLRSGGDVAAHGVVLEVIPTP